MKRLIKIGLCLAALWAGSMAAPIGNAFSEGIVVSRMTGRIAIPVSIAPPLKACAARNERTDNPVAVDTTSVEARVILRGMAVAGDTLSWKCWRAR